MAHSKRALFHACSVCCREQLAWVLPSTIGPSAVLISVGVNVLMGGTVELVKLLTAGSYISIITYVYIKYKKTVSCPHFVHRSEDFIKTGSGHKHRETTQKRGRPFFCRWSMTSITYCRQQWKDLEVECKNIDGILELPDSGKKKKTLLPLFLFRDAI